MANIPSAVVGAGNQHRPPWYEQLLLSLAAQGPQTLMAWLEHRQQQEQAQGIDAAAQSALGAFAQGANPAERGAIAAGGGQPGLQPTGAAMSPPRPGAISGGSGAVMMPSVRPMEAANQPNMAGMKRGVAAPLLQLLQQQRTQQGQQAESAANVAQAGAQTAAIQGGESRAQQLFPLQREAAIAQTDQAKAATAESRYNLSFAKATESLRRDMLIAQTHEAQGRADEARAAATAAVRNLHTWAADRASADMLRVTEATKSLGDTFPILQPKLVQAMAAQMILGTPAMPARADLIKFYESAASSGGQGDLDAIMNQRVLDTFGVSAEDMSHMDALLSQSGDDADAALAAAHKRGATRQMLEQQAAYYTAKLVRPVKPPEDVAKSGVFGSAYIVQRLRTLANARLGGGTEQQQFMPGFDGRPTQPAPTGGPGVNIVPLP